MSGRSTLAAVGLAVGLALAAPPAAWAAQPRPAAPATLGGPSLKPGARIGGPSASRAGAVGGGQRSLAKPGVFGLRAPTAAPAASGAAPGPKGG